MRVQRHTGHHLMLPYMLQGAVQVGAGLIMNCQHGGARLRAKTVYVVVRTFYHQMDVQRFAGILRHRPDDREAH